MLDQAQVFIPILTPSYFNSAACRNELEKFLEAEQRVGRRDLILPIYYIQCPALVDADLRKTDELATVIHERQIWDWGALRHHSFRDRKVRLKLQELAEAMAKARRVRMPRRAAALILRARVEPTSRIDAGTSSVPSGVQYDGIRFRLRVEAQWAVFFKTVRLKYEYERRYESSDKAFLVSPEFWLPELNLWLEVRIEEPMDTRRLQRLADSSGHTVLLAIGPPEPRDQISIIRPAGSGEHFAFPGHEGYRFYFADDRRNEREFWLLSDAGAAFSIGPQTGPNHGKDPGL